MPYIWCTEDCKSFWQRRKSYLVFRYPNLPEKIENCTTALETHRETEQRDKTTCLAEHTFLPVPQNVTGVNQISKTSADIRFWASYGSWTFCSTCNCVSSKILPHNFLKRPKNDNTKKCICSQSRYIIPLLTTFQPLCYH